MEELIFFAVLIFFSIVESIARSRKQRKGGGQLPEIPGEAPPEWEREVERAQRPGPRPAPQPRPRMSDVPSYDDDASFDARTSSEAERSFDDVASSDEERRRRASSSESMIPGDIWAEIEGLAREAKVELPAPRPKPQPRFPPTPKTQVPQPPRRGPQPSRPIPKSVPKPAPKTPPPPRPQVAPKRPTIADRAAALEGTAAHPIHLSHAGYGTDPSERARSAQDVLQSPVPVHADASAVRNQLRGQGGHALRQALILSEVLGPPVSSKPDPYSE